MTVLICILLTAGIVAADYYRAIFVSYETLNDKEDIVTLEEEKTESKADNKTGVATVTIFGDQLIHENVLQDANKNAGGKGARPDYEKGFSFANMYQSISYAIESADLAICTQNTLVGAADSVDMLSGYPLFNAPKQLGYDLELLGFDIVNVASNHMLDFSDRGYKKSVSFWKKTGVEVVGGYETKEEMNNLKSKIYEINGIKFGILAYTASTNGLNPIYETTPIPTFTFKGSSLLSHKLKSEVSDLKAISDFVIVLINWGIQNDDKVTARQRETGQILVDAGADLIVGNGSTVLQIIESLKSTDGKHSAICAYSLGNTLCTMQYIKNLLGGFLTIEVIKEQGRAKIQNAVFTPTFIHYDENVRNIAIIPLSEYSQEQFDLHGSNLLYGYGEYQWLFQNVRDKIPFEMLSEKQ